MTKPSTPRTSMLFALALACALVGCGSSVSPDAATLDGPADRSLEDRAVVDAVDALDVPEILDVPDVPDAFDASDVVDVVNPDGPIEVPCDPERPAPAGVGRSCGPENAQQCREVHYCGGVFTVGRPEALVPYDLARRVGPAPFEPCDYFRAVARSGYVDAYEVTVGRFRRWVDAGMPRPAVGSRIPPGIVWTQDLDDAAARATVGRNVTDSSLSNWPSVIGLRESACTWTSTPGPNEDRPINCGNKFHEIAFCWWDGKAVINEIAWEYLATNRGTTGTSYGDPVIDAAVCEIADVGALPEFDGRPSLCPRRNLPLPFDARPRDVTSNPAGVFGMFGGLREWIYQVVPVPPGESFRQASRCDRALPQLVIEGAGEWRGSPGAFDAEPPSGTRVTRGVSWVDYSSIREKWKYATSRPGEFPYETNGVDWGFRCQRWERP